MAGGFRFIYLAFGLEYELTFYDSAVHRFNHYTMRTPRIFLLFFSFFFYFLYLFCFILFQCPFFFSEWLILFFPFFFFFFLVIFFFSFLLHPKIHSFIYKRYLLFCLIAGPKNIRVLIFWGVLRMKLNFIWWWGSNSQTLRRVKYPFITITPRSTLTRGPVGRGCRGHRQNLWRGLRLRSPPNDFPDMILNNLIVRLQQQCSFGKGKVSLQYHQSQVHSGPEW